jgi:3-phenylpropionate/cinnamic acid dioxygenase small subunit
MDRNLDTDHRAIRRTLMDYAAAIDGCDWAAYRDVLCDEVDIDYSSYRPGSVGPMSAEAWVDRARNLIPGLEATQHTITNERVDLDGDRAVARSYIRAEHVLSVFDGDPVWTLVGTYRHELERHPDRWRIAGVTLTVRFTSGDRRLMSLARERAAGGRV